jgi:hypothetical protein
MVMNRTLWENIAKNIVILSLLIPCYFLIRNHFVNSGTVFQEATIGNTLISVGILAVIACFGNFAFTYEKVHEVDVHSRLLAHFTTGILMFLIGISLAMTSVLTSLLIGDFFVYNLSLFGVYLASVLYDFWDLKRKH